MNKLVCLVTGANRGIGRAAALGLARRGAAVIMVCRDPGLGAAARDEIVAQTGNPAVSLLVADLASLQAVRRLAREILGLGQPLHVLVNNAALAKRHHTLTADGLETTFAVNHLAPFLLTNLLLDLLKSSAPARIINVASMVHLWGRIRFDDLMGEQHYRLGRAYNQSKLANVLFTYELARRLKGSGVTANCLHPGVVRTDFAREYHGLKGLMSKRLWRPFMRSPEKGADTIIYLATSAEVEGATGRYVANRRAKRSSRASYDRKLARRLWEVSEKLTGLTP